MSHSRWGVLKERGFPSIAGIVVGLVTGTVALFTPVSQPFWVTFKVVLVVLTIGYAAANLVGLLVLKYRQSPEDREGEG